MERESIVYLLLAFQIVGFIILAYLLIYLFFSLRRVHAATGPAAGGQAQVSDLVAELKQAADEIRDDLTARSSALQRQIEEAQRHGDRLEGLLASAAAQPASRKLDVPPPARPEPRPWSPPEVAPRAEPESRAPGTLGSLEVSPVPAQPVRPAPLRPADLRDAERYQEVFRLAEQGLSSLEIARRTRVGREEIELLLGLRNGGAKNAQP